MSKRLCFNCNFESDTEDNFCQECGAPLDLQKYIESKIIDKSFSDKVKSFFGNKHIDDINREIEEFIVFSAKFSDYENDVINLKSFKLNEKEFKEKYCEISKLDDFKYIDVINDDVDLNKKLLFLKKIKTFMGNFDEEIKKSNELLKDIKSKTSDIDIFNNDLKELMDSDELLDVSNKNDLIQVHKSTYDFFDQIKVKELNIDSKDKIEEFLDSYENIDSYIEEHNEEIKVKHHDEVVLDCAKKAGEFIETIDKLNQSEDFIPTNVVDDIEEQFRQYYDILEKEKISDLNLSVQLKSDVSKFLKDFKNLNQIIDKINDELEIKILQNKLDSNVDNLQQFFIDLDYLIDCDFYITFIQKDELKDHYKDLFDLTVECMDKLELNDDYREFLEVYSNLDSHINSRNETYVENELIKHKEFFDNIEGKSLDEKQRLAVVKNELNTQIIAGAGCGKTLTVNAKVRYLIEKKGIKPADILCLSFSNLSVRDLEEKLPEGIEISTFHKLGGKILRANNQTSRPDDAALDNFIKIYFRDLVIDNEKLCQDIFEFYSYYFYESIEEEDVDSMGEVYDIEASRDFHTLRQLYGGDNPKNTWKNETVKSFEELIIANYLFAHQIDYEYEKVYEHQNQNYANQKSFIFNLIFEEISEYDQIRDIIVDDMVDLFEIKEYFIEKDYLPDFYLPDDNIYLEHFGVNRQCKALWLRESEAKKYSEGIKWKRGLHKSYGSKLIETYSYYMSEDRLLKRLEEKLEGEGVEIKEIDYTYLISKLVERDDVNRFKDLLKLIKTFIELFKGNNYTIDKFSEFKKSNQQNPKLFERKRTELFLNIVEDIYISYENYLKEIKKIDFNDMINNATRQVQKGNLKGSYKYIIVDEYQDTSFTRYNLLKAIQEKTHAKVCVVGDDWQSIYRFTGCDVSLFTQFEKFFENPVKLRIETTYRNSQDLIDISGEFIKQNPNQIDKKLKSKKAPADKPVKIAYYNIKSAEDRIKKMELIVDTIAKTSDKIMIVGRNNFDICYFADGYKICGDTGESKVKKPFKKGKGNELIYTKNKDLKIKYITVHKSKGLEEDNVILINLENKRTGFPNQIEDDSVLNFVINDSDQYDYGEERRLFYVALTRTKNNVYLLAPETHKSVFVEELEKNIDKLDVITKDELSGSLDNPEEFMKDKKVHSIPTQLKCPVCQTGDVSLILVNKGSKNLIKFFACSHERCSWDGGFYSSDLELLNEIEICPECGGVMQVKNGKYGPFYSCSNRCKTPKLEGEKLGRVNKIIEDMESDIDFEVHKSHLKCPKCSQGNIILKIHPENKSKSFACSNEECDWSGGKTSIDLKDLDKIQICPDCGGILILRNGKKGPFLGCSNFPKCRHITNIESKNDEVKHIKTKLTCPSCKKGDVLLKGNKFICSECNWDGGQYTGINLDTLEYCANPECSGITFMRNGRYGEFRSCSNYFKTKCDGGRKSKKVPVKKSIPIKENTSKKIKTKLKCPECRTGDVILNKNISTGKGYFKCSNDSCNWDGGPFNQSEELLNTLDYCPVDGCMGLTFVKQGKYGPFKACTYFVKTKCDAGRK